MSRPAKTLLRAALGLALLAAVLWLAEPARVAQRLHGAHWPWLAAGLLAAIASNLASALRWRSLAAWLGAARVSVRDACRWYFQAIGLNALLPGAVLGGDVYRALVLQRAAPDAPGSAAAAGWSVLLDRVSGVWMLCVIGAFGAAACARPLAVVLHMNAALLAALALLAAVALLALPWALPPVLRRVNAQGAAQGRFARLLVPLAQAAGRPDFGQQMRWQAIVSAAVQILSAAALACGALALGVQQPLAVWAFAIAPIFLMAALPASIGGWGTREAAAALALAPFGVATDAAVGAGMLYGLYALAQGALGALAFGLPKAEKQENCQGI